MRERMLKKSIFITFAALSFNIVLIAPVFSCTRILLNDQQAAVMVGRTMDWSALSMPTSLRIYPRGIARSGAEDASSLKWTAKYGSLVTTAYEAISVDG